MLGAEGKAPGPSKIHMMCVCSVGQKGHIGQSEESRQLTCEYWGPKTEHFERARALGWDVVDDGESPRVGHSLEGQKRTTYQ